VPERRFGTRERTRRSEKPQTLTTRVHMFGKLIFFRCRCAVGDLARLVLSCPSPIFLAMPWSLEALSRARKAVTLRCEASRENRRRMGGGASSPHALTQRYVRLVRPVTFIYVNCSRLSLPAPFPRRRPSLSLLPLSHILTLSAAAYHMRTALLVF
jgi:hypothetical protein